MLKNWSLKNLFKKEIKNEVFKDVNFNWLKNQEEKEYALNMLISAFPNKLNDLDDSLKRKIITDEEIDSTALMINEFQNICLTIWNDDLNENNTYKHLLIKLAKQGGFSNLSNIEDKYLEAEENSFFDLSFSSNNKDYSTKLKKNIYLNYAFLKLIIQLDKSNGNFYLVENEKFDDGFTFMHFTEKEYDNINEMRVLKLILLTESVIDEINVRIK